MSLRRSLLLALLLAPTSLLASSTTYDFKLAGKDVGRNTFSLNDDGTFESSSTIKFTGLDTTGTITGKLTSHKLVSFTMKQTANGNSAEFDYHGGAIKVSAGGQSREINAGTLKSVFSNFHPGIQQTILSEFNLAAGGQQDVNLFIVESGQSVKVSVVAQAHRQVRHEGKTLSANAIMVRLPNVDVQVVYAPDGQVIGFGASSQQFFATAEGWDDVFVDPTSRHKELSQPTFKVKPLKGEKATMRDGVHLAADVYLPDSGDKFPVILERTPYGKEALAAQGEWYAKRGFAYVAQDVRGRQDSEGVWEPLAHERKDGYDTLDWISKQPWCDGNVGMIGASYDGYVQWCAAVEHHPVLKCIVPQVSPPDAFFNLPYDHGIPMLMPALWWANIVKTKSARMDLAMQVLPHPNKLDVLPITKVDDAVLGVDVPFFNNWWSKDRPSQFAGYNFLSDIPSVKIPVLNISGWFDGDGIGTKLNYAAVRRGGNEKVWLIYGPWIHFFNTMSKLGEEDFGTDSIIDLDSVYLRWFDTWLKHKDVNIAQIPKVQAFVTGENKWHMLKDWPDPRSKRMTLYVGNRNSLNAKPEAGKPYKYTYDPSKAKVPDAANKPILTDISVIVHRIPNDKTNVLFRSAPLKEPLTIGGPISFDLYFSTDVKDTDFFVGLTDEDENGQERAIGSPGKIRARYISGWETPKLLKPGKIYKATVDLWDTARQFKKGHRLVVSVLSSAFPAYARNLNTGEPLANATRMVVAHQTIYHDAKHPSALHFSVLP